MRNPFRYFNSSPEVIRLTVLMYVRYPLSLRQVEDLLFESGIDVCHETVRFWWNRFGPMFAAEIRKRRIRKGLYSHWRWHLDEVYVRINGENHYLWRAVDHEGEVLEVFATKRRDRKAALDFLKRAMKRYGEGSVAGSLHGLSQALSDSGKLEDVSVNQRKEKLAAEHILLQKHRADDQDAARDKSPIEPVWLCAALNATMPDDTVYVDELTTHAGLARQHLQWNRHGSLFSRQGGLGQGLGLALGVKLANPDRPVVSLIGDGAFLYNPVLAGFGASRDFKLPLLVVIFDNQKYAAMQNMHHRMYPEGTAVKTQTYFGTNINGPDYVKIIEAFGGYGERVEGPAKLIAALQRGRDAVNNGSMAVIDVVLAR